MNKSTPPPPGFHWSEDGTLRSEPLFSIKIKIFDRINDAYFYLNKIHEDERWIDVLNLLQDEVSDEEFKERIPLIDGIIEVRDRNIIFEAEGREVTINFDRDDEGGPVWYVFG